MDAKKPSERERIIEEATRWFLANREADAESSSDDFLAWLRASPAHVREYLGVSAVARDLPSASDDVDTLTAILMQLRAHFSAGAAASDSPSALHHLNTLLRTLKRFRSLAASDRPAARQRR